jgi:CO dehydrogenase maturation factor
MCRGIPGKRKSEMNDIKDRPLAGLKIGVFGKGGGGKSTVTVLLAQTLTNRGYPVIILDADSTNLGMPSALGLDSSPRPLIEYFGGFVFSGGRVTCPVDDPEPLHGGTLALTELPEEYRRHTDQGIVYLEGAKMGGLGPGAGCDGPIAKIARDLRILPDGIPPVMLVDFKAGLEDSIRGVITGLDWVLIVVDPSAAAVEIALQMREMLSRLHEGWEPATAHLKQPELIEVARRSYREAHVRGWSVVINRVADEEIEAHLRSMLEQREIPVSGILRERKEIMRSWLKGESLKDPEALREVGELAARLEEQLRGE